jgi:hypothetical protein
MGGGGGCLQGEAPDLDPGREKSYLPDLDLDREGLHLLDLDLGRVSRSTKKCITIRLEGYIRVSIV